MSGFLEAEKRDGLWFFPDGIREVVDERLSVQYRSAEPYPHIAIDNFLPREVLDDVVSAFPLDQERGTEFARGQEHLKSQFLPRDAKSASICHFFNELNGVPFLQFLEDLTGITSLIPDPYFSGGGFHETKSGGKLAIHADFNLHQQLHVERRINLLIYLNREWKTEYGGQFEMWDKSMSKCQKSVEPAFGRAVIFNTTDNSYHGHPDPLLCPQSITRRSIALYYYTVPQTHVDIQNRRTTHFVRRPNSTDRFDWQVQIRHTVRDLTPPLILRSLRSVRGKLAKYKH